MKTKGLIYSFYILLLLLASCEKEHIMTKFKDSAGFVGKSHSISVKTDFTYYEISVVHRSIDAEGSKAELKITPAENSESLVTLDKTILDFDESDTIKVKLSVDQSKLVDDITYSVAITFTDEYLQHGYGGYDTTVVEITKFQYLTPGLEGTWTGKENYNYTTLYDINVTVEVLDADNNKIRLKVNTNRTPALYSNMFTGWGETFDAGTGNSGNIDVFLSPGGATIDKPGGEKLYLGETNYDYKYYIYDTKTGLYDKTKKEMTLYYAIDYAGTYSYTGWKPSSVVLTKD